MCRASAMHERVQCPSSLSRVHVCVCGAQEWTDNPVVKKMLNAKKMVVEVKNRSAASSSAN